MQNKTQEGESKLAEEQKRNSELVQRLISYKIIEEKREKRKKLVMCIILHLVWIVVLAGFVYLGMILLSKYKSQVGYLADILGLLTLVTVGWNGSKFIRKKLYGSNNEKSKGK